MNEAELLTRARKLGGKTLFEVASLFSVPFRDPARYKGFVGELIEKSLGATSGSRPVPDFEELGIELKTLPIDRSGRPRESTFVCCVPAQSESSWESSSVRKKLARVLWVPVEADVEAPARRVGSAFLWSPSVELERTMRGDWEDLNDLLNNNPERISARHGRALQLRPKAAHGAIRKREVLDSGEPVNAIPRAFYLRRATTSEIVRSAMM